MATSPFSADARRLRLTYAAWSGLALLEDAAGQIAQLTGCAEAEALPVWERWLAALEQAYSTLLGLPIAVAQVELESCDTAGQPSLLPPCTGRGHRLGMEEVM
jgi:hypothetical protein